MNNNSTLWAALAVFGVFAGGCTVEVNNNADAAVFDTGGSLNTGGTLGTGGAATGTGGAAAGTGGTTAADTDSGTSAVVGTGGTLTTDDASTQQEAASQTWDFSTGCRSCLDQNAGPSMTGCAADAVCNAAIATFSICVKTQTADECAQPFGAFDPDAAVSDYTSDIVNSYASDCEAACAPAQGDGG